MLALAACAFSRGPPGALAQAIWAAILAAAMIALSHNTPADGLLYAGITLATLLVAIAASHARGTPFAER